MTAIKTGLWAASMAVLAGCAARPARGANLPISGLGPHSPVAATDTLPCAQSGSPQAYACQVGDLKKFALTSIDTFGADPAGAADSTGAIQAALNSGQSVSCNGIYKTSSTLTLSTTANHGQVLEGAGWTNGSGTLTTAGRCVFKPVPGMTGAVFRIDGTPFSGYVQGFGFENLTVDLTNMSDVSTNIAFNQAQAYDGEYKNVRVVNDGANKRAWLFSTGAYTTVLNNTQGNILDFEGTSTSSGVTTITVMNHDGGGVISNYANSLKFLGGAFQGRSNTKFYIRNGTDYQIETDVEGGGVYLNVDSSVNYLRTQTELQGFSGIYMIGAPAPSLILLDQQTNYNTYPFNLTWGYFNFNNQGVSGHSSLLSGSTSANYYLQVGRTGLDALMGVAAAPNDFLAGSAAGDTVLGSWQAGESLFLAGGQVPGAKVTSTGFSTFGTGTLRQGIVNVKPASDTDSLTVQNATGTYLIDFNTQSGPLAEFLNGMTAIGYSGNFTGQTWKITTPTGQGLFQQVIAQPAADSSAVFQVNNQAAASVLSVATNATPANSTVTAAGTISAMAGLSVNAKLQISGTAPTYSSGFSTGTPTIAGGTTGAFNVTIGATPGATGGLTMPSAATGWNCVGVDRTTAAGTIRETASATNSVTFALASTVASDVLQFQCTGY